MSDYSANRAYDRWEGRLGDCLKETRELFSSRPMFRWPGVDALSELFGQKPMAGLMVLNWGRVVWGYFARAYWPIYAHGVNNHYGTILLSFDPSFEDSPGLFKLGEDLRAMRDSGGEPANLRAFTRIIRNDFGGPHHVRVPTELTGGKVVNFQTICIRRRRLPGNYLHHRLVPVLALPVLHYATVLPLRFWPTRLRAIWQSGDPLLSPEEILAYQSAFPAVP